MNRETRRKMEKKIGRRKAKDIRKMMENYEPLLEGDKVRIKTEEIVNRIETTGATYVQEFVDFIKENTHKIFTVEYDEKHKDGLMVCLKEDIRPIKWLFWEGDLEKIKLDK